MSTTNHLAKLTADIVSAYVEGHRLDANALPGLVAQVHAALGTADRPGGPVSTPQRVADQPAVDARKSVFSDHLVCLECGLSVKILKRHLVATHGMTAADYRKKWNLPVPYPMIAPRYAKLRSKLAKASGLGRHR